MKNRILIYIACILSCITMAGCGVKDKTIAAFINENKDELKQIKKGSIEKTDAMEYDEGELVADFNEVANVNVYSEAAVLGTVMGDDYNFVGDGGIPWTFNTVKVEEVLKGDITPGDIITVGQQTGYVALKEYYDTVDPESQRIFAEHNPGYTEEEMNNTYFYDDDRCPDLLDGYKLVFALSTRELPGLDGTFWEITAGKYGQFFKVGNNKFMRIFNSTEYEISPYEAKVRENPDLSGVYTIEELQNVFLEYQQ